MPFFFLSFVSSSIGRELIVGNRAAEPELVSLEEIQAKMDPIEAERLRTVRNIGIAVRVSARAIWTFHSC